METTSTYSTQPIFQKLDRRILIDKEDNDSAYFSSLMLKLEYLTKILVAGVVAVVGDDADRHRYSLEYRLLRADSLGLWTESLDKALSGPPAQVLLTEARPFVRNLTERVGAGDWRHTAVASLATAAAEVGVEYDLPHKVSLREFFSLGVRLRNRSRGHGAPTTSQCSRCCPPLAESLDLVARRTEFFQLPWVHLHRNISGKYRVTQLLNDPSPLEYLKRPATNRYPDGVYIGLKSQGRATRPLPVSLVFTDPNVLDVFLANGNFKKEGFEVLSYTSNTVERRDGSAWTLPPARLPASETEGNKTLEPLGNTFANVPHKARDYITRPELEHALRQELRATDRHPILTLTGPGGIGKTSLAIAAIRDLSHEDCPPYETTLWISARDVDLLEAGPKPVSPRVLTQTDISRAVVDLLQPGDRTEQDFSSQTFFEHCLSAGGAGATLFVLDNFETVKDPSDTFRWLDTHIRPPNKLLITTRFRDFRGDYWTEVGGMSDEEASELVDQHARSLGVLELLTGDYKKKLIRESGGHPYVLKILLGEVAKERQPVKPQRIVATSDRLLRALFKRTFDTLSPAGQRVFLLLCSWRSVVPEIAIEAVSLRPTTERFDVSGALDELRRFSLIDYLQSDGEELSFVGVPMAAMEFGRRELTVSPFRIAVEEDRKILMEFGPSRREDVHRGVLPRIESLVKSVAIRADESPEALEEYLPVLEYLASRVPQAYRRLAVLTVEVGDDEASFERAKAYLRNFLGAADVSELVDGWLQLADLCAADNDVLGEVHALCEAALLPTADADDVGRFANRLNQRLYEFKVQSLDKAWSGDVRELLSRVTDRMEKGIGVLSATNCSRLAWLYLNVGNSDRALHVARIGAKRDPENEHCQNLVRKLENS